MAWTILSVPLTVAGFIGYLFVAVGELPSHGTISLGALVVVLGLTLALAFVHEGVHGIAMLAFGARPKFGVLKMGGITAGLYTTAPGHRFSRGQYLIAVLAPFGILALLGIPVCLLPFGEYLPVPFAVHLAGCIGDLTVALAVLRAPKGAVCEDLRDGTRFWRQPV